MSKQRTSLCFSDVFKKVWLQYQCLWDMQAENIYNRLGEDLNKWQALLVQIRKARGTFDNAETRKEFGPVVIDYGKVKEHFLLKAYFHSYLLNFDK